ncbi:hypothetical protein CHUAL_003443 [Chamberlinius hualienensis]
MMLSTSCSSSTLPRASSKSPQHSPMREADCVLATALYDNAAETSDELAFMKGDILTVLEKNYKGQIGWWLCSLRGKVGICPGNRLRLLGHVIRSSPPSPTDSSPNKHLDKNYDTLKKEMETSCYDVPNGHQGLLKGLSQCTYDVPSPNSLYDVPKQRQPCFTEKDDQQTYDIPTPMAIYDVPVSALQKSSPPSPLGGNGGGDDSSPKQLYDVPRQVVTTPIKGYSLNESVYDVPPQVTRDAPTPTSSLSGSFVQQQVSPVSRNNWSVISESNDSSEPIRPISSTGNELPLELNAAMDMLVKLQQDVQMATHRLFALVKISPSAYDLKNACNEIRRALQEFLDFAKGALTNLVRREDNAVCNRLNKLCRPLTDASNIVGETCDAMEKHVWAVTNDNGAQTQVDRMVACARTVVDDVRQVACFIQGNSTLIFRRKTPERLSAATERPLPPPPLEENPITETSSSWGSEDYDYVNLEPKENHLRNQNDYQIVGFHSKQLEHLNLQLGQAVTMFLTTVENNQPPKVFVDHGKAVILVAHKLMFIGDSIHRNVFKEELKKNVQRITDELCDALKTMVQRIKMAALQFPSVTAVQHMVDSVVGVSQAANKLNKIVINYVK